jgi:3-oxoacyl-[acyl-carrier protein] reductase
VNPNFDSSHVTSDVMEAQTVPNTFVHTPLDSGVPAWARDFDVVGRVILITGAGQGIGRELARQFAAAGATAVVADLNLENAQSVRQEIVSQGGKASAHRVDISDPQSVQSLVDAVASEHGRIDVLINNAAMFASLEKRPFEAIPLDEWDRVIRVNITGPFLCARAVAPLMRKMGWGRIINISSDAVPKGVKNYLHYVTSKSAIIGMTNAMARELGPDGINVNCIRPGPVATEVERAVNPTLDLRRLQLSQQCLQRGMVHTDLVGLMIFLATPAASFITGQTLAVDGGYTHSS